MRYRTLACVLVLAVPLSARAAPSLADLWQTPDQRGVPRGRGPRSLTHNTSGRSPLFFEPEWEKSRRYKFKRVIA